MYQKEKEVRRFEKGSKDDWAKKKDFSKDKCYYCGRDRHPNTGGPFGWKDKCPAKNATCKECKKTGHFTNMPACKFKKVRNQSSLQIHRTKELP